MQLRNLDEFLVELGRDEEGAFSYALKNAYLHLPFIVMIIQKTF